MTTDLESALIRKEYRFWDDKAKKRVLDFVREHGRRPALMAKVAGVSYETLRQYLKNDEAFRDEIEAIVDERNCELEAEARRRAMEGSVRKKYDREGNLIEEEQIFSDTLMVKLLEANDPSKFRPQKEGGASSFTGGVLLIPMKGDRSIESDPSALMKRLEDLSDFQNDLREKAEGSGD